MTEAVFANIDACCDALKLDFSSEEFAVLCERNAFTPDTIAAVELVFDHLKKKKAETTINTLLRLSRLPLKAPKTFENFDFTVMKGRDVDKLKVLPTLASIYAHKNLAFIGPAGTGKTHLAQAFGYACCQKGLKTYYIDLLRIRHNPFGTSGFIKPIK